MANLYSSDDITVLGGPSTVNIDLDFGPTGQRGSKFFIGNGNPNSSPSPLGISVYPFVLDMYINLDSATNEYRSLYQYQNVSGVNTWVRLINLIPNIYSLNISLNFVDGLASTTIPVISLVSSSQVSSITASKFNVQHSLVNNGKPSMTDITVSEIVVADGTRVLPLSFSAYELNNGNIESVTGQKMVHIFISVV
jgi:hypothetical protein